MEKESIKVMSTNREARHEYFIEEEYEEVAEDNREYTFLLYSKRRSMLQHV